VNLITLLYVFAEHQRLTDKLGRDVYFAYPYASWQRGLNENTNGLLRPFFPKGIDFSLVSHRQVARAEQLLNDRSRKSLGYRTSNEVFNKKLAQLKKGMRREAAQAFAVLNE